MHIFSSPTFSFGDLCKACEPDEQFFGVIFHTVTAEPRAGADQKGEAPQNNIIFVITSSIYFNQMPASVLGWVWVGGGWGYKGRG